MPAQPTISKAWGSIRPVFVTMHLQPMSYEKYPSYYSRYPISALFFTILFVFDYSITLANAATCYWPNGEAKSLTGTVSCNSTGQYSACCMAGDECTTNGLCKAPSDGNINWYWRQTCTDPTWQSDACPKYCNSPDNGSSAS